MNQARTQTQVKHRTGFSIEGSRATCVGDWQAEALHDVEKQLSRVDWPAGTIQFDLGGITSLDTVGAWLLHRTKTDLDARGRQLSLLTINDQHQMLMDLV